LPKGFIGASCACGLIGLVDGKGASGVVAQAASMKPAPVKRRGFNGIMKI
jgi:hypothetical protein